MVVLSRIRRRFGIKPGTRINFVEEGERIIFQPVTKEYINSFCAALAKNKKAELVTADLEFKPLEKEIKIIWLK